jgi:hypothetical protein
MTGTAGEPPGLENIAKGKPASQSSLSRWSRPNDAQGAVSGHRTGRFGFHTDEEPNPWWQVDLLAPAPIHRIRLWNREDIAPERARNLVIELSEDGVAWDVAHATGEAVFGGIASGTPLDLVLDARRARFVRVRKLDPGYLHLDEVEVYAPERPEARLLREFCAAICEPEARFVPRGIPPFAIHFGGPATRASDVRSLSLRRYGRFGNNVTQLLHAIHFARRHGIGRIHLNEVNPTRLAAPVRLGGIEFRPDAADGSAGADLSATMYYREQFFRTFATLDGAGMAELAGSFLAPLFGGRFADPPRPAAPALHIHLRAGDVFGEGKIQPLYVQPPLAFYTLAIDHARRALGVARVVLIYENDRNPCIPALRDRLAREGIPFAVQSGTLEEDMAEMMAAEHLVVSRGTFAFPVFLLSSQLRTVYGFRDDAVTGVGGVPYGDLLGARGIRGLRVAELTGSYIAPDGWRNAPEQRRQMLDHAESDLRLEG